MNKKDFYTFYFYTELINDNKYNFINLYFTPNEDYPVF